MRNHIHQSNLIEDINDDFEDKLSMLAWKYLIAQKRLTQECILETHRLIMQNQLKDTRAGTLRRIPVTVGNEVPPEYFLAAQILHNWTLDMRGWRKLNPKQMHVRFEKIHPFVDGNGRTGRMLLWWHEIKLGLTPTLIKASDNDRQNYYQWFAE
jgi:Fic family protein